MKKVINLTMPDNTCKEVDLIDLCKYNLHIGNNFNIGVGCYFGKDITIKNSITIGDHVKIGNHTIMEGTDIIGDGSTIANRVKINRVVKDVKLALLVMYL